MKYNLVTSLLFLFIGATSFAQIVPTPEEFLGYPLGSSFTPHYKVVEYFKKIADGNENVMLEKYGETYEGRTLYVAFISSKENLQRLDDIRKDNLKRAGLLEGAPEGDDPVIVWLSYNVHGDEASSTEAALKTVHFLVDKSNKQVAQWLKNTVVVIDPCLNPDGRERYINFYKQYRPNQLNLDPHSFDHQVPWPGGRVNHYLFDLNRDWVWLTQKESQERVKIYNDWLPQVHVDFHEMGINSSYYFAPAAEPFHMAITSFQRSFQKEIGNNNARYFDKNFWLYFTSEEYDLLYPSYGDTYPIFNGAIGMTYEQGGGSRAGLAVLTEYGDTLTLKDRIEHHFTTGISTIETSSKNANRLLDEFGKYFAGKPVTDYQSFVIKAKNSGDKINRLLKLLDLHRIQYGYSNSSKKIEGFDFSKNATGSTTLESGDVVINLNQPKSRLASVLFNPVTSLSDTLTYDITAWSLPYAYGLEAYAVKTIVPITGPYKPPVSNTLPSLEKPYAWLLPYNSFSDSQWLLDLLRQGVQAGITRKPMDRDDITFPSGSVIITRTQNQLPGSQLDSLIATSTKTFGVEPIPVASGMSSSGIDLGSNQIVRAAGKKIALLAGEGTSPYNVGEIWHFFEQELHYPITMIPISTMNAELLDKFDEILIPEGRLEEQQGQTIEQWISRGGKAIVFGRALSYFATSDKFSLSSGSPAVDSDTLRLSNYGLEERESLSESVPGAIFRVKMDNSHPLAYGYDEIYYTLSTQSENYSLTKGDQVGKLEEVARPVSGFAGSKAIVNKNNSLVFGVESHGNGTVVYLVDNPLFRRFWENGKMLVFNAIFLLPE